MEKIHARNVKKIPNVVVKKGAPDAGTTSFHTRFL
jgi:hypothetical protein